MDRKIKTIGKAKLTMQIIRNGKEYDLPLTWKIKQFFRELRIQFFNLFRAEKGYADVLTQAGEEFYVDVLDGTAVGTQYIGWGTGTGTHAKASTALFTEATEARVAATRTQPVADKIRYEGTLTASAAETITNAGTLTALTGGILIVASDFTGVALGINEGIKFQWTIELT